jgi:ParB family chromosome partitioning protein
MKTVERPPASIRIGRRHRRDLGDIDGLAASIASIGLLHPVVITPGYTDVSGVFHPAHRSNSGVLRGQY